MTIIKPKQPGNDFADLLLQVKDPATKNLLVALIVHLELLAVDIPSAAAIEAAANVRALRKSVPNDEVIN